MGIIRGCFTFFTGTVFGIYLAQSYQVPDVKKEADTALIQAKQVEEKYRKSKIGIGNVYTGLMTVILTLLNIG
ncbi:hypothetical protein DEO72_LG8g185 [Vigna unguiculata]|uniref:Uncharacterized protein n=1 Tax=Vigna unguiculata TaxID=3917 RepID=A0A4D6MN29_VIGUN|nr:hypothetical protein DEO72_LG8g185 [Vigna unguiculata]